MNVASLELCKELYELSGWSDPYKYGDRVEHYHPYEVPAYDLGFLLRKLPNEITHHLDRFHLIRGEDNWYAKYECFKTNDIFTLANTPEDAAARLCIELIKQGLLK